MGVLTTALALALAFAFTLTNAEITDCSKGLSQFKINGLGFWPDPAVRNSNSTISFDYTVPEPGVTGGTATYSTTFNFIPFSPTVEDLCTQVTCPILPGRYNQSTSSTFPDAGGSIVSKIEWKDQNGVQLLCAQVKTKVA